MGGGFELALGCHYRVAAVDAQLGLPEVKLGLLPGAGGTQRLPRAIGVERALNMIVSGNPVRAEELRDTALLDGVIAAGQDLRGSASSSPVRSSPSNRGPKRVRDLPVSVPEAEAYLQFARTAVRAVGRPVSRPRRRAWRRCWQRPRSPSKRA